jgi:hypothetical protein
MKELIIIPLSLKEANQYVKEHHRHHKEARGYKFALGVTDTSDNLHGVAIVGRPVSRMLDDGSTLEVTRLATDGHKNACSCLYAATWRVARAMGYKKLVTYILTSEPGTSLKAAGWKCIGKCGGRSWNRANRPRIDNHPTELKLRFEMTTQEASQ